MTLKIVPAILCGGSGTRLWPLSRSHEPKQLQTLFGEHSLLTHTALRMNATPNSEAPLIICSQAYAAEVENQLFENGIPSSAILEEPMGRDTAAAAGIAAHWVNENLGEDAILVLVPADHYIEDMEHFHTAIIEAAQTAQQGNICTIGVTPDRPETGFGYIKRASEKLKEAPGYPVEKFVEKPDAETAQMYIDSGDYVWNAGIFAVRGSTYLNELSNFEPDIYAKVLAACNCARTETSPNGYKHLQYDPLLFSAIEKKSIDYAIMERTENAAVVPAKFGWSDVGSWASVRELGNMDKNGNNLTGDVRIVDSSNCLVQASGRVVALIGMQDVAVIDTPDALLVCHTEHAQSVKKVHQALEKDGHSTALGHGARSKSFASRQRGWARNWLFNQALPLWADIGLDREFGGVYEALNMEGKPLHDMGRRFRVQARQVYAFAHAHEMGWKEGAHALESPLNYMLKHCWLETGGWGHIYNRDGSLLDGRIDTYDQAFALLGLAWAYKVTGEKRVLEAATKTKELLFNRLRHPIIGFVEGIPATTPRRANPHMHLFEAAIHWMELFGDEQMADLAEEIFELYTQRFCVDGLLREYFHEDLTPLPERANERYRLIEPGHLLEWVFLLRKYAKMTGRKTNTTAVLEAFSDTYGIAPETGLVMNYCYPDGTHPENVNSRLWPQTEYIRLKLSNDSLPEQRKGLEMLERLKKHYLNVSGENMGYWHDEVDGAGKVISSNSPASTLYHVLGCLMPLINEKTASD
ncbi:mannose-1-phosphate guanylyltransferase/mannose-6-phosphate isomerase [Hirschia baltica]|uniref:mannose-1-phosphate guanylyltransferase n=1 Tax=Hirschia baltica (strain ATCC 49814 / DSM 5838 / IFAM 1418) TaxID=582402 RepID=C6XPQ6_HIRBI|nr:mannose-1-phosphate guanylyltransferase/mannose-6-phosphate isomerase [Hirschia baltica]ACT60321.1 mannose-1-phosphate guanylyltransferase/mannose-6-phosphate isomerase [Hirschia baltica ATCC 49814]